MAKSLDDPEWRYHFAQTFPFRRRNTPVGYFDWLVSDPRLGVGLDLHQVPLAPLADYRLQAIAWKDMETAFGVG